MQLNKTFLLGRLGKDPELKTVNTDQSVTKFSIAVNDGYYNKENTWVDRTVWADVVAWGKLAEKVCNQYPKGTLVLVEAKYSNRKVEKDGQTRYYHEFVASSVKRMEKKQDEGNTASEKHDPIGEDPDSDLPF